MIRSLHMDDTILTTRQSKILDLLKNNKELTRLQISSMLISDKPISRITLIRELNKLVDNGHIIQQGKARATTYRLKQTNKHLYYIDIDEYFKRLSSVRNAKKTYNKDIIRSLTGLFNNEEQKLLQSTSHLLQQRKEKLDPTIYKRELERLVIEFSWKSSQIEGNTYDLLETETLIKQKIEAKGHSKEEAIMILNHKDAFDNILNNKSSFRTITYSDIMQLHTVLTKKLSITSGIRSQRVGISGTDYVPMNNKINLERALRDTIKLINLTQFPPEKSFIASFMIAYIQPFYDGNKRSARMLANAILISYGYLPLTYRNVEVDDYKKAMILFYEQNNLYHLKRMFLEQQQFSSDNYFKI